VKHSSALLRSASVRFAALSSSLCKLAEGRFASLKLAFLESALVILASDRSDPHKSAQDRVAPYRCAPAGLAFLGFLPRRSARVKFASDKLTPSVTALSTTRPSESALAPWMCSKANLCIVSDHIFASHGTRVDASRGLFGFLAY
jgi:hypothetical protein